MHVCFVLQISRDDGIEDVVRVLWAFACDQPNALCDTLDMRIHGKQRHAVRKHEDTAGGLGADPFECYQPRLGILV
jgi:hypothetical protein